MLLSTNVTTCISQNIPICLSVSQGGVCVLGETSIGVVLIRGTKIIRKNTCPLISRLASFLKSCVELGARGTAQRAHEKHEVRAVHAKGLLRLTVSAPQTCYQRGAGVIERLTQTT